MHSTSFYREDRRPHGEDKPNHVLTVQDALDIRRLYESGCYTMKELAVEFRVCHSTISGIIHRRTWKHI